MCGVVRASGGRSKSGPFIFIIAMKKLRLGNDSSMASYVLATILLIIFSWLLHECGHYLMGCVLGYPMIMTMNSTYSSEGTSTLLDSSLIDAAGPFITIVEAFIGFYLLRRFSDRRLYPIVFVPFFMRLLALGISFHNANDEARMSLTLGTGKFTLPVLVCAMLFYLVYRASIEQGYRPRFQAITAIVTLLVSTGIILLDQAFDIVLLS